MTRVHVYLGNDHNLVRQEAKRRGVSISQLTQAALIAFLKTDDDKREALLLRRLDRLARQFTKLELDLSILTETLALYIQYELAIAPPVPVSDQAAAKAQARERFQHFISRVAGRMAEGKSLINDVTREFTPNADDFFKMDLQSNNGEGPNAA